MVGQLGLLFEYFTGIAARRNAQRSHQHRGFSPVFKFHAMIPGTVFNGLLDSLPIKPLPGRSVAFGSCVAKRKPWDIQSHISKTLAGVSLLVANEAAESPSLRPLRNLCALYVKVLSSGTRSFSRDR